MKVKKVKNNLKRGPTGRGRQLEQGLANCPGPAEAAAPNLDERPAHQVQDMEVDLVEGMVHEPDVQHAGPSAHPDSAGDPESDDELQTSQENSLEHVIVDDPGFSSAEGM